MIPDEKRQAILLLARQGVKIRDISRKMDVSRNAVRNIIRHPEPKPVHEHDAQLLIWIRDVFIACRGNAVRIGEVIKENHDVDLPYSTLTRIIREQQLRKPPQRSGTYTYEPGAEMQHDTSPHRILIGDTKVTAQCASLVLAYSRKVYIQYYPNFTRFECKVFLDDAIRFMDGACARCMIDNTCVVLASGCGADAVITPEMALFGRIYGFSFRAHSIGNPNRKAHVERSFDYVERNFLAGRTFHDWDDLNKQARAWCEQVANKKPKRSLGMSPDEAYVMEKPHLLVLPAVLPPVYHSVDRTVDIDAYVSLDTNRYSVPEYLIGKVVMVHKYLTRVVVFFQHKQVADHPRIIGKRKKKKTDPSHHKPLARKRAYQGACSEETLLLGHHEMLDAYIRGMKKRVHGRGVYRMRRLLNMQRTYPDVPFMAAIRQAQKYGMYDLARLESMILKQVAGDIFKLDDDDADDDD